MIILLQEEVHLNLTNEQLTTVRKPFGVSQAGKSVHGPIVGECEFGAQQKHHQTATRKR